ncbi:MAG: heme-binding protein, partial [Desulfuromonadales bacterium]|nr:heme-binding protein [Desulfuromonadales bacterium]
MTLDQYVRRYGALRLLIGLFSIVYLSSVPSGQGLAQDATFVVKQMTTETALKAAQAALGACREQGFQVAVAVTDRSGTPQAFL